MPKAIFVPQPVPKELIPAEGVTAVIAKARIVRDQWTSIGTLKLGLGITVNIDGKEYSALFSLDRDLLAGSVGRLLVAAGIDEVKETIKDENVKALVGMSVSIRQKGGKVYWYPSEK
jgi:hypothetical protein